jgi:hypothetical protein
MRCDDNQERKPLSCLNSQCPHQISTGYTAQIVVKALCYKKDGRGFKTRWGEWIVSVDLILLATLGSGVYSASNRNEYQKQKINVSGGVKRNWCIGLTTLPPSVSGLSRQCGILNIWQPYRPVTGIALLYGDGVCFLWGINWTVSTATSSQYLAVNCEPTAQTMWDP